MEVQRLEMFLSTILELEHRKIRYLSNVILCISWRRRFKEIWAISCCNNYFKILLKKTKWRFFRHDVSSIQLLSYRLSDLQLTRTPLLAGKQDDPITLYSEFGYGSLEMFILSPMENSLQDFRKKWPKGEKIDMGQASAAILLVFRKVMKTLWRLQNQYLINWKKIWNY